MYLSEIVVEFMTASGGLGVEWMTTLRNCILDEDCISADRTFVGRCTQAMQRCGETMSYDKRRWKNGS